MNEILKELQQLRAEIRKNPYNIRVSKSISRLENQVLNKLFKRSLEDLKELKKAVKAKYQRIIKIGGHDTAWDDLPPIYEENLLKLNQPIQAINELEIDHSVF